MRIGAATAARDAADKAAEAAIAAEARANALRQKAVPWMSEAASVSNQSDRVLRNLLDDPKALDPFGVTGIPVEGSGYTFDVTLMSLWIVKVVQGSVGGNP